MKTAHEVMEEIQEKMRADQTLRHFLKAQEDAARHGVGFLRVEASGRFRRVDPENFWRTPPMTDPRERARELRELAICSNDGCIRGPALEAAAALDALADERDRLREAVRWITDNPGAHTDNKTKVARAALREGDET